MNQGDAFGTRINYPNRVEAVLFGPVAYVVERALAVVYATSIIDKGRVPSGFGKGQVIYFVCHKLFYKKRQDLIQKEARKQQVVCK